MNFLFIQNINIYLMLYFTRNFFIDINILLYALEKLIIPVKKPKKGMTIYY